MAICFLKLVNIIKHVKCVRHCAIEKCVGRCLARLNTFDYNIPLRKNNIIKL